jgi:hypothetical protein
MTKSEMLNRLIELESLEIEEWKDNYKEIKRLEFALDVGRFRSYNPKYLDHLKSLKVKYELDDLINEEAQ